MIAFLMFWLAMTVDSARATCYLDEVSSINLQDNGCIELGPDGNLYHKDLHFIRSFPKNYFIHAADDDPPTGGPFTHNSYWNEIQRGYESWNGGPGSHNPGLNIDFNYGGTVSNYNFANPRHEVLTRSRGSCTNQPNNSGWFCENAIPNLLAVTIVSYRSDTHGSQPCALKGADIVLRSDLMNGTGTEYVTEGSLKHPRTRLGTTPTKYAIATLVAHEVGHVLGLEHNEGHAMMSHTYPYGGDSHELINVSGPDKGFPRPLGQDYQCLRDAQENVNSHPALKYVYRDAGSSGEFDLGLSRYGRESGQPHNPCGILGDCTILIDKAVENWAADVDATGIRDFEVETVFPGDVLAVSDIKRITATHYGTFPRTLVTTWALKYSFENCSQAIARDNGVAQSNWSRKLLVQIQAYGAGQTRVIPPFSSNFTIPPNAPAGSARVCARIRPLIGAENHAWDSEVVSEDHLVILP